MEQGTVPFDGDEALNEVEHEQQLRSLNAALLDAHQDLLSSPRAAQRDPDSSPRILVSAPLLEHHTAPGFFFSCGR